MSVALEVHNTQIVHAVATANDFERPIFHQFKTSLSLTGTQLVIVFQRGTEADPCLL